MKKNCKSALDIANIFKGYYNIDHLKMILKKIENEKRNRQRRMMNLKKKNNQNQNQFVQN